MAMQDGSKPVCRQEIAASEEISTDYVGQILMKLKTVGLVRSHRGIHGGFSLGKSASAIAVADILKATEGEIALAPCTDPEDCARSSTCVTRNVWLRGERALEKVFAATTVDDLAREALDLDSSRSLTFHI